MIIPDVNILIYTHHSDDLRHEAARDWWERTLTLSHPIGLPWITVLAFIRITTHGKILNRPPRSCRRHTPRSQLARQPAGTDRHSRRRSR